MVSAEGESQRQEEPAVKFEEALTVEEDRRVEEQEEKELEAADLSKEEIGGLKDGDTSTQQQEQDRREDVKEVQKVVTAEENKTQRRQGRKLVPAATPGYDPMDPIWLGGWVGAQ